MAPVNGHARLAHRNAFQKIHTKEALIDSSVCYVPTDTQTAPRNVSQVTGSTPITQQVVELSSHTEDAVNNKSIQPKKVAPTEAPVVGYGHQYRAGIPGAAPPKLITSVQLNNSTDDTYWDMFDGWGRSIGNTFLAFLVLFIVVILVMAIATNGWPAVGYWLAHDFLMTLLAVTIALILLFLGVPLDLLWLL